MHNNNRDHHTSSYIHTYIYIYIALPSSYTHTVHYNDRDFPSSGRNCWKIYSSRMNWENDHLAKHSMQLQHRLGL